MIDYVKRLAGPYTGEGLSTFTFSFKIFEPTDVYVATAMSEDEYSSTLEYGAEYTVSMNEDQDATPGGGGHYLDDAARGRSNSRDRLGYCVHARD